MRHFFYTFTKKLVIMDKKENYSLVIAAEEEVIEEMTPKVYYMLGASQRAQLVQDKLPTKPLYCLAKVSDILNNAGK